MQLLREIKTRMFTKSDAEIFKQEVKQFIKDEGRREVEQKVTTSLEAVTARFSWLEVDNPTKGIFSDANGPARKRVAFIANLDFWHLLRLQRD